jgi:hypothetical protein
MLFSGFPCLTKAKRHLSALYTGIAEDIVMRQKRKLAEHVWYKVETSGTHLSSVAGSLPPHRGAVFKQRPKHNKRLCLFRAQRWVGGDASIQHGTFFAAVLWRGIQATPQARQKVVPVSGATLGGAWAMAETKIPAAKTCELAWVSPRRAGGTVKVRFSRCHQNGPRFRQSTRLTAPSPRKKKAGSLKSGGLKKAEGKV